MNYYSYNGSLNEGMVEYWNYFVETMMSFIAGDESILSMNSKTNNNLNNSLNNENYSKNDDKYRNIDEENVGNISITSKIRNKNKNTTDLDIQLHNRKKFRQLCEIAKTVPDIKALVEECISHYTSPLLGYKGTYNKYIGWGIPSPIVLNAIYKAYMDHCKKYPMAKLVDYGAGTGVYSLLLEDMGIQRDRLIAVDLPIKTHATQREFYSLLIDDKYCVHPDDVMLVVWGSSCYDGVQQYVLNGGKCLIIQGEIDGCTFCAGYLDPETGRLDPALGEKGANWKVTYVSQLPSWISSYTECISINTKYEE